MLGLVVLIRKYYGAGAIRVNRVSAGRGVGRRADTTCGLKPGDLSRAVGRNLIDARRRIAGGVQANTYRADPVHAIEAFKRTYELPEKLRRAGFLLRLSPPNSRSSALFGLATSCDRFTAATANFAVFSKGAH